MSEALALPTRKQEDFRYADLDALAGLWPVAREEIVIVPGGARSLSIVETGESAVARHLVITLEDDAEFDLRVLNAGPAYGRIAIDVRLGARTRITLGAAQLGTGSETLEIIVQVTHAGPDAVSRQTVRSVLAGHAAGTCLGRVAVARGADGTDAEQSVRAMLLSRTATANARPELEIYADDVKCAHGCAVGELDEAALFYLQSRGLPLAQAKQLMLQAFIAEAFAGAPEEERLLAAALDRLGTLV